MEFDSTLFHERGTLWIPRPSRSSDYRTLFADLGRTRQDISVDRSVTEFLDLPGMRTTENLKGRRFRAFDLVDDADYAEVLEGMPVRHPSEPWHAVAFVEAQRYGNDDEDALLRESENVFFLAHDRLLVVRGVPSLTKWLISILDAPKPTRRFDQLTRFLMPDL